MLPATQVYYDAVEDPSDPRSQAPSKASHAHDLLPKLALRYFALSPTYSSACIWTIVAASGRFDAISQGDLVSYMVQESEIGGNFRGFAPTSANSAPSSACHLAHSGGALWTRRKPWRGIRPGRVQVKSQSS